MVVSVNNIRVTSYHPSDCIVGREWSDKYINVPLLLTTLPKDIEFLTQEVLSIIAVHIRKYCVRSFCFEVELSSTQ